MTTSPRRTAALLLAAAAALVDGCSCDQVPDAALTECQLAKVVPGAVKTDILFVIDDSGSMAGEQTNLSNSLQSFIDAMAASPVQNDYQIGVTTTSVESFGGGTTYTAGPNAAMEFPAGRLVSGNGTGAIFYGQPTRILPSTSTTLVADFMDNVIVGTNGSGKEQPLRAVQLALSGSNVSAGGANEGFLRAGARLAVIILSDEDDCSDSATPRVITGTTTNTGNPQCHDRSIKPNLDSLDSFVTFLRDPIAGEVRDPLLAVIGPVSQSTLLPACGDGANSNCSGTTGCSSAYDTADRLVDLLQRYGSLSSRLDSVCLLDFSATLQDIAGLLVSQTVPLGGAPADWRMLIVGVRRPDGIRVTCTTALEGTPAATSADAVFSPPAGGGAAKVTFQNACTLGQGYKLEIDVICAG